jgi:fucose 4-O-acetylase-like acetyltransferase
MKRYYFRLAVCLTGYAATLVGGLLVAMAGAPVSVRIFLALLTASMVCGLFWAIFRLLAECDDEYQRLLLVRQTLLATAATLAITTCWQFLAVYDVLAEGPQWIGVIWLAMFGLAAPIVRWRA